MDKKLTELQAMINKAAENDLVRPYVQKVFTRWKRLLPNKNANRRTRVLTVEESWKFWEDLPKHLQPVALTGMYTGMRKGEILGLTWDRVDLDKRVIYLEADQVKEDQAKTVYISDHLAEVLGEIPRYADQNHIFLFRGEPIKGVFYKSMRATCEKAGIKWGRNVPGGFVFHDLRRTFVHWMRKGQVDSQVVRSFTGHHSDEMHSRYSVVDDAERLEAVRALDELLEPSRAKGRAIEH